MSEGITPARAGTTDVPVNFQNHPRDHPRSRGDHLPWMSAMTSILGSPPLARGPRLGIGTEEGFFGITPARAGTTPVRFGGYTD